MQIIYIPLSIIYYHSLQINSGQFAIQWLVKPCMAHVIQKYGRQNMESDVAINPVAIFIAL